MEKRKRVCSLALVCAAAVILCGCTGSNRPPRTSGDFGLEATMAQGDLVQSLEWSPDGQRLACVIHPGILNIWDTMDYSLCVTLSGPGRFTGHPAWSPDGALIAISTGPSPPGILIYSTASGALQRTLGQAASDKLSDPVHSLSWAPNGSRLAAGLVTGTVRIWETAGWGIAASIAPAAKASSDRPGGAVAFSPDGRTLACSDGANVSLREAATGKLLRNVTGEWPARILWSPDGGRLGLINYQRASAIVNLTTGNSSSVPSTTIYSVCALSSDFCWSAYPGDPSSRRVYAIQVHPVNWSGQGKYLVNHTGSVTALAWSPGSDRLASGSADSTVKLWSHDEDRDMYADAVDRFPADRTQWNDTDRDGFGDNQAGRNPDAFPQDPREWKDTDKDGMGDNGDPLPGVHNVLFMALVGISAAVAAMTVLAIRWVRRRRLEKASVPEQAPVSYQPYPARPGCDYPDPPKKP
jgi:WD40 repeat protein